MKYALATLCAVLVAASSFAQGTVAFSNKKGTVDAPVFIDQLGGAKVDQANGTYMAQLYAGTSAANLAPIGAAVPFRAGAGAGYWNPAPDAGRTIASVAPGAAATIQVVAWNTLAGATYEAAKASGAGFGQSSVFTVTTGGAGSPPGLPADLVGLTSFAVTSIVPEPSVLALGAIGAIGLLIRRRK